MEYNGRQHYQYIPHFHRTKNAFKRQQENDAIKVAKCKEKGIDLIIVPYTVPEKDICKFIVEELRKKDWEIDNDVIDTFDIYRAKDIIPKTKKLINIIEKKGGKLLEGGYATNKSIVKVQCNKGHIWSTRVKNIRLNRWCPKCGTVISNDRKKKISEGMKKFLNSTDGKKIKLRRTLNAAKPWPVSAQLYVPPSPKSYVDVAR